MVQKVFLTRFLIVALMVSKMPCQVKKVKDLAGQLERMTLPVDRYRFIMSDRSTSSLGNFRGILKDMYN